MGITRRVLLTSLALSIALTAALLLSDIVALKAGDWIVQHVANSAVGRLVIGMAKRRGSRPVTVPRRAGAYGGEKVTYTLPKPQPWRE